jgi:hypothetical protein
MSAPIAKIFYNQPICEALRQEASKRENPYASAAFEAAASKVSNAEVDLTLPTKECSNWLQCLGPKTREFVKRFLELYRIKSEFERTRDTNLLFPPEWRGTLLEDDERIMIVLDLDINSYYSKYNTDAVDVKTRGEALNFYFGTILYNETRQWLFDETQKIVSADF